jgi:DNA-binding transcriptional LysR family regulator
MRCILLEICLKYHICVVYDAPMDLNILSLFVVAARSENFTAAADVLEIERSSVSRSITGLERALGVELFSRTTRKVSLTNAGAAFYGDVEPHLRALRDAVNDVSDRGQEPSGLLRLSVPGDIAATLLVEALVGFKTKYPNVQVDVRIANRRVDLVAEGFDAALRVARLGLKDSTSKAIELMKLELHVYGAPDYIEGAGASITADEASSLQWLQFRDKRYVELPRPTLPPQLISDDILFLLDATRAGMGVAALPSFLARRDVAAGRLVRILPDVVVPMGRLYLLCPPAKRLPRKVRVLADFLSAHLRKREDGHHS